MLREQFEESKETLCEEMLDTIRRHFDRLDLSFDMDSFVEQNAHFIDHMVVDAHFTGAEVFPIDIPIKNMKH